MSSSATERHAASAKHVSIDEESLRVELTDGRTISVPVVWYPRLVHGSSEERSHWRITGGGRGIHWPDLDEDISVDNLLAGESSGESQASLKRWLELRENPDADA